MFIAFILILIYLNKIISISEITITIKGTGEQKIINNLPINGYEIDLKPSRILINNIPQDYTDYTVRDLINEENNITMIWDYDLDNCNAMFYSLGNIISVDLSNFDSSHVTIMRDMFYDCISLTSINLNNFITSSVNHMGGMFYNCKSLTSIDLSNFDTSSVTNFEKMFSYCISLESLNINKVGAPITLLLRQLLILDICFHIVKD